MPGESLLPDFGRAWPGGAALRLVSCEHGGRRVSRTEHDGTVAVLAERTAKGKRFNSPHDVVVRSDGSVWFTDPPYRIDSDYEAHKADSEIGANHGLAFTSVEASLFVVDTLRRTTTGTRQPLH